jgi:hypothetical protein
VEAGGQKEAAGRLTAAAGGAKLLPDLRPFAV